MNIVVDENIPNRTIRALREQGHAVTDVKRSPDRGSDDEVVWATALRERALLITTDKGFMGKWDADHHGILVIRLRKPNLEKIHSRVMGTLLKEPEREWVGMLRVVRDQIETTRYSPKRPLT